ncbi:MAG: dihydrolipoyl dehydrogenase [Planctomycetota bacterium]
MAEINDKRKLVVIGAGPGGYAAAFHAADLGIKVTLIDKEENPGGVCLYRGCIPTKALLHIAKVIADAQKAKDFGVEFGPPNIDADKIRNWKNGVVKKLTGGLGQLCKLRNIEYIQARAKFVDGHTVEIEKKGGNTERLSFEHAILAVGAVPVTIPGIPSDLPGVMDSTAAIELENIPQSLLVIGGGYIGLELGSVYACLGTKVSVVEMTPNLMPGSDEELVKVLAKRLEKLFESIMLNTKVAELSRTENGLKAVFEGQNIERKEGLYEKVLVAVGRKPNSANIGLENTKVVINDKGFVEVDKKCRTNEPAIFAVGDISGTPLLAHRANHQGMVAAKIIAGIDAVFEPSAIPFVEYTEPEIAECGVSEKQAKAEGRNYKVGRFPWAASGRAATLGESEGLTKLIIDADTERILGAGVVGTGAGELIAEAALAVEMSATASDIAMTIHPHPTLSETIMEAAEAFLGHSIHIYKRK